MADNSPTGPVELGAQMDYSEHEGTYKLFIKLAKYGTLFCVALMISMAFGFFVPAGFFASLVLFLLLLAVGGYLLRDLPAHIS
ncbi:MULTISPECIES: aa3-type cytochrome c oxidase subunit IV [Hyphomicrobiales]|jgi:hypothetical protein|uniref:aa3-type cytochrome c oxidase subunit IV n=1 Tax=Hyphomicrobiales TaxID=356 RepID=UPI0003627D86|nr:MULTISPECIES: aa3-type cytochrome c oxidase subunit IV [Phyllobacteriaceae]MCX8572973.1 aa3-type cytochrome c oxidase subunit IV [Aminobacter sp. MET-1]